MLEEEDAEMAKALATSEQDSLMTNVGCESL